MTKRKVIGLWALIASMSVLPAVATAKNGFLVAPGRVQIDVEELKTHTFIITNTGDEQIRLSIEPIYLPIDDPTMKAGTHLRSGVADDENIVDNVRVSPRRLSLKPGQRRDIRVQLKPLSDPRPGDYRAHLLVKMDETAYTTRQKADGENNMNMELNVKMETAVALYGRKDEPVIDLSMSCDISENGVTEVSTTNPTAWRFEGLLSSGETQSIPLVMLRESVRTVAFKLPESADNPTFTLRNLDGETVSEAVCKTK